MAKNDLARQIGAGIFFLIGSAIVCAAILYIGFYKGITRPQFQITVLFDKVGGLNEGAPVRLSGVTVGTVRSIGFLREPVFGRDVEVELGIFKDFEKQLRHATQISIQTEGVLGAKYVEIGREPGDPSINIAHPILGEPILDVYDIAEVLENSALQFSETAKGINIMMGELEGISRKSKRLLDRIERRVIDGNLFKVF